MHRIARTLVLLILTCAVAAPGAARPLSARTWVDAHGVRWTETVTSWSDDAPGVQPALADEDAEAAEADEATPGGGDRLVAASGSSIAPVRARAPLARFGPFAVLDAGHALLTRETSTDAPRHFTRMMAAYPGIRTLELVDCPGTIDDNANLVLGRMIHDRGLATDVPPGGSVRSGAVDLFLAGVRRTAAADATFAVHAWMDEDGLRPTNFAPDSPVNRKYVRFYHLIGGMAPATAAAFYDLTNSVPNERALWLSVDDIARYAAIEVR